MTIRELAAGNPMIMDINIDIRENGKLKHIYRFGCGAEYYNSDPDLFKCKQIDDDPEDVKKYVTVDNTEINTHDISSLRNLSEFEVLLLRLSRAGTAIIIDKEYDDDYIQPEKQPEASFS